jgi:antitoxin ParD1/3/4
LAASAGSLNHAVATLIQRVEPHGGSASPVAAGTIKSYRGFEQEITMGHVDKRSITLSAELAATVDEAVAAGEYASASEVIRDALRQWKERRDNFGYTLDELRALIQEGIDSGPSLDGPTVMAGLRERIRAKALARGKTHG